MQHLLLSLSNTFYEHNTRVCFVVKKWPPGQITNINYCLCFLCFRYILTSFYTKYDQAHFVVNTVSLLTVLIPKLPQLHGVRIFGINKYWRNRGGLCGLLWTRSVWSLWSCCRSIMIHGSVAVDSKWSLLGILLWYRTLGSRHITLYRRHKGDVYCCYWV